MALLKKIDTNFGVKAEYWKIGKTFVDWHNKSIQILVLGFSSKEVRKAGSDSLVSESFLVSGSDFDSNFPVEGNLVQSCYTYVKKQSSFKDSKDD